MAKMHPMQWPPDILEEIWTTVRRDTGMWRARMKQRLWTSVHKELEQGFWCYWESAWGGGKYWEYWRDACFEGDLGMFFPEDPPSPAIDEFIEWYE